MRPQAPQDPAWAGRVREAGVPLGLFDCLRDDEDCFALQQEPLQALDSAVLGELPAAARAGGANTKSSGRGILAWISVGSLVTAGSELFRRDRAPQSTARTSGSEPSGPGEDANQRITAPSPRAARSRLPGPLGERRGRSARTDERRRHRAKRRDVVQDAVGAIADTYRGRLQTILGRQDGRMARQTQPAPTCVDDPGRQSRATALQVARATRRPELPRRRLRWPAAHLRRRCQARQAAVLASQRGRSCQPASAAHRKQMATAHGSCIRTSPAGSPTSTRSSAEGLPVRTHHHRRLRLRRGAATANTRVQPRGATAARGQTRNEHPGPSKAGPCVALGPQP